MGDEEKRYPRIVQIAAAANPTWTYLFALLEDGSLHRIVNGEWKQIRHPLDQGTDGETK